MKLSSFEELVRTLNVAAVPFIVVGGLAVNAHGYGRQTADVDLVVRLDAKTIENAFRALASIGYQPRVPVIADDLSNAERRAKLIEENGMTVIGFHSDKHPETPVDIFASEPFDFAAEYDRALVEEVAAGIPVHIVGLDTLLRLKRAAGRPQDLADIAELSSLYEGSDDA
jgi:predicted nucleotidyltransferase